MVIYVCVHLHSQLIHVFPFFFIYTRCSVIFLFNLVTSLVSLRRVVVTQTALNRIIPPIIGVKLQVPYTSEHTIQVGTDQLLNSLLPKETKKIKYPDKLLGATNVRNRRDGTPTNNNIIIIIITLWTRLDCLFWNHLSSYIPYFTDLWPCNLGKTVLLQSFQMVELFDFVFNNLYFLN